MSVGLHLMVLSLEFQLYDHKTCIWLYLKYDLLGGILKKQEV